VRGLWIYVYYQFVIPTNLQAQFHAYASRGAGVVGTSAYPSTQKTTVKVRRPERPRWTLPLATKVHRPRPFNACTLYPTLHHVGFYSLIFQIHHPCMWRELPCSIHTPATKPRALTRHPRVQNPSNKPPKIQCLAEQYAIYWYERLSNPQEVWLRTT
jgi:hypothetical protein